MTEKEKAIAYDEAIERAKKLYGNGITEEIFPELKEDDDERIKKNCINFLELQKQHHAATFEIEECIDWLKKQGKSSTDKTPRFNVGDWVVYIKSKDIYRIEKKENYEYTLRHILGGLLCLPFSNEGLIREWDIQDTKAGDILYCKSGWMCIFKAINNHTNTFSSYCSMSSDKYFFSSGSEGNTLDKKFNKAHNEEIYPATKEQCDTFMKAMNDAGYEWDAENKELKKKD